MGISEKIQDTLRTLQPTYAPGGVAGGPQRTSLALTAYDDMDGTSKLTLSLRATQAFLAFVNLCIYMSITGFERKHGGASFLSIVALINLILASIAAGLLVGVGFLSDRFKMFSSIGRGIRQIRIAIIVNVSHVFPTLCIAIATTTSANKGSCKATSTASADPNDPVSPGYCRNKRAGAAFFWLILAAWVGSLAMTAIAWYHIRRNPRSTAFAIPGSTGGPEETPFDPDPLLYDAPVTIHEGNQYRSSNDYYTREVLFGESTPAYDSASTAKTDFHNDDSASYANKDPFDQNKDVDADLGFDKYKDPYDRVRRSMDVEAQRTQQQYH